MTAPLSALYAGLAGLLLLALAALVVRERWRSRVGLGDGGDPRLARAIAAHRNAVEYVPVGLVLMLVAEMNHLAPEWLHLAGASLLAGRLLHAVGLSRASGRSAGRLYGTLLTWLTIAALAVFDIAVALA